MQKYSYVARDKYGKVVKGMMIAETEMDLANKIGNLGYYLTKTKLLQAKQTLKMPTIKAKDLLTFTIHLATFIEAGIPLIDGLGDLARHAESENVQKVIDDVRLKVESGSSLKEALSAHPRTFPKLYLALIGAGESTGKLTFALNKLAEFLEWQMDLTAKIKEAATYPIILTVAMVGVVVLLVVKVIPIFKPMFAQARVEIPLATRIVLAVSTIFQSYWWLMVGSVVLVVVVLKLMAANDKGRYILDSAKLKMPIAGSLLHKIILSRFCHILSLAIQSGVNVLGAFDIAIESMSNVKLEQATKRARDSINLGEKIGTSLEETREFPSLVVRMVSVGEESGTLAQSLEKVSGFYDKEIPRAMNKIFALFEPIMIMVMGLVVGGIALAIFMPMFKLAQGIGD